MIERTAWSSLIQHEYACAAELSRYLIKAIQSSTTDTTPPTSKSTLTDAVKSCREYSLWILRSLAFAGMGMYKLCLIYTYILYYIKHTLTLFYMYIVYTGNSYLSLQHLQQAHKKLGSTTLVLPKLSEALTYLSQYQSAYCEAVGRLSGPERGKVRVYMLAFHSNT